MQKSLNRSWQSNDTLLQFLVEKNLKKRIPWLQLSKQLSFSTGRQRSGKQCRERWLHQLNPRITKEKWGYDETNKLFQLHRELGNRWSAIAEQLSGRTDNIVKNYFYSMVRRIITKINGILAKNKQIPELRQMRPFGSDLASKLILVSDGHYQLRVRLNNIGLQESAKGNSFQIQGILNQIINLHQEIDSNVVNQNKITSLLAKMHEFRSNSKKRKRSRKSKQSMRFYQIANQQHQQSIPSIDVSELKDLPEYISQIQPYAICQNQSYSQLLQNSSQQILAQNNGNTIGKIKTILGYQQKCISTESQNLSQQLSIPIIVDLQQRKGKQFKCIFTPICEDDWQFPQQAKGLASPFSGYTSFLGL